MGDWAYGGKAYGLLCDCLSLLLFFLPLPLLTMIQFLSLQQWCSAPLLWTMRNTRH